MQKRFFLAASIAIVGFISSCKTNGSTHITGTLQGVDASQLFVIKDDKMSQVDTVLVKGGKFTYDVKLQEPTPLYLVLKQTGENVLVFAENGNITLDGKAEDFKNAKISGSKIHEEFGVYLKSIDPIIQKAMEITKRSETATSDQESEKLQLEYAALDSNETELMKNFVKAHATSPVSSFLACSKLGNEKDVEKFTSIYSLLQGKALSTVYGQKLTDMYKKMQQLTIGGMSKDFTLPTVDGKTISLQSYRGKYVLVDFWASWCKPCREENPNVVAAYVAYHAKGLEILGVSLDNKKEDWTAAIAKDKLTWSHGSDLQGWSSPIAELYGIQGIPANFLVDPTGKIIAKDLRGAQLQETLAQFIK